VKRSDDFLKTMVMLLATGDEALVRCRIMEHFGDDLMVAIESPRGSTRVQVGADEIVNMIR
jgi:hypothetical protein